VTSDNTISEVWELWATPQYLQRSRMDGARVAMNSIGVVPATVALAILAEMSPDTNP
jgi:hypothetical protein